MTAIGASRRPVLRLEEITPRAAVVKIERVVDQRAEQGFRSEVIQLHSFGSANFGFV